MAYTSIVCGVTGSAHAQKAALEAAVIAKRDGARLTYVYAVDSEVFKQGMAIELTSRDIDSSLERLGGHIVALAKEIAQSQGVEPKTVVRKGAVLEVLAAVVREEQADLLVLGHEKRTFLEKVLFEGSVEEHIAKLKAKTGIEVNVIR